MWNYLLYKQPWFSWVNIRVPNDCKRNSFSFAKRMRLVSSEYFYSCCYAFFVHQTICVIQSFMSSILAIRHPSQCHTHDIHHLRSQFVMSGTDHVHGYCMAWLTLIAAPQWPILLVLCACTRLRIQWQWSNKVAFECVILSLIDKSITRND